MGCQTFSNHHNCAYSNQDTNECVLFNLNLNNRKSNFQFILSEVKHSANLQPLLLTSDNTDYLNSQFQNILMTLDCILFLSTFYKRKKLIAFLYKNTSTVPSISSVGDEVKIYFLGILLIDPQKYFHQVALCYLIHHVKTVML